MKKITRVLAIVCCAALLAGVGMPAVSAADTPTVSLFNSFADLFEAFLAPIRSLFYNPTQGSLNPDGTPRQPTLSENLSLLSYRQDSNGVFYVEHTPWQKQFGFNQLYDITSPFLQLVYGTIRIKFQYDYVYKLDARGQPVYDAKTNKLVYDLDKNGKKIPKDWLIQMWKGRYGLVMIGAEIGVYTKPSTQKANHYYTAIPEEELIFAMDVYQHNFRTDRTVYLFTRGPETHWWLTGFVPGNYNDNRNNNRGKDEIIMVTNIQFPNKDMLGLFVGEMEKAGFKKGSPNVRNVETYTTSGNSIKYSWQFIDEDM